VLADAIRDSVVELVEAVERRARSSTH